MGAKESKQFCISYEDAVKRVTESELQRLSDAFKKSAGVGRLYLSRKAFQQEVLFEGVPSNVVDLLYGACGGNTKGISFKDLLCGLVLLTRGTQYEKIKFLWNLYCNDGGSCILKHDYLKAVNLSPYEVTTLFGPSDRVNFEQYQDWIIRHRDLTVLSKWLLSEPCISLTSELETPTFYQSLAGVTHLEEKDIGDLEKEFWCLKNCSANGQLDLQMLGPLISPPIPKNALKGLFNAFDENRDGHIDFKELCCGVSAACRGPVVERTRFCFKIFDVDSDGVLNHDETMRMIKVLLYVAKENRKSNMYKELTEQQTIDDIIAFTTKQNRNSSGSSSGSSNTNHNSRNQLPEISSSSSSSAAAAAATQTQTQPQMQQDVANGVTSQNVLLTAEDFMMWSVESSLKLVQPFLDLTFELCHIVFGLWPQCKHMEHDIVYGWWKREEKRQYRVGQFWYLISRDWWLTWLQYTQNSNEPSCEYCKKLTSRRGSNVGIVIDEASVCDESFTSNSFESSVISSDNCSLHSVSSGISAGRRFGHRPGPIDNTNLITPNPYKNIRTLTGEGGHLRRDTPLVQNHDFELVPKTLWKAFSRWYGDNLPLPRQVIQPPNSPDMELELYPLNLRILLHESIPHAPTINTWNTVTGGYGIMASGYAAMTTTAPSPSMQPPPKRYLAYTAAFSRLATIRQIGEFLCDQLNLKIENIRLWHVTESTTLLLEEDQMTLRDLTIHDSDQILLEIRNKDLTWPEELGSLALDRKSEHSDRRMTRASILSVHTPGATGLHNLGNTCFMNAALQVLFNTQPLAQYFRRNMHRIELNRTNKLGTRGHLAIRYAELLSEVWMSNTRSVAPLKLRFCVTKYAPQFAGGGQHDSQELLEWFLDALHEDLNRVTEKPYSELKDSMGRPDKVVAAEAWAQHHARNQSIIIDLFYGQLKSKVSCLCCGHESVRFDPFSLLSLPLPVENYIYFEALVIMLDGSIPIKYGLRLNSEAKYFELKRKLAPMCGLNPNYMLICELRNAQINQILFDKQQIKQTTAKELIIYQLPEECGEQSSSTLGVNIEKGLKDIQRNSTALTTTTNSSTTNGYDSLNSLNYYNYMQTTPDNSTESLAAEVTADDLPIVGGAGCGGGGGSGDAAAQILQCTADAVSGRRNHNDLDADATKQSTEISRSPEDTFTNSGYHHHQQILSAKLLHKHMSITSESNEFNDYSLASSSNTEPPQSIPLDLLTPGSDVLMRRQLQTQPQQIATTQCNYKEQIKPTTTTNNDDNSMTTMAAAQRNFETGSCSSSSYYTPRVPLSVAAVGAVAVTADCKVGKYLVAVHRKITRQDSYFLSYHKTRPSLFGVPLLIANCGGAHKDLYCAVWLQVRRLLSPLPASTDQANHAADCDDSLGYDFPFSLRAVKRDGLTCALCPWSNFCRGCEIPCTNDNLLIAPLCTMNTNIPSTPQANAKFLSTSSFVNEIQMNNFSSQTKSISLRDIDDLTIAIDWDPTALHLRYQSTLERLWKDHESVAICRKEQTEPVDLNHCLEAFTSEENLEEWYHCSHCKGKKSATKKLQIWKLPPILIIHLKRFNCVNNKWVKSQKVVHFPFDNFDPTPYLASVPQETILRHKELLELQNDHALQNHDALLQHTLDSVGECDVADGRNSDDNSSERSISNNKINNNNNSAEEIRRGSADNNDVDVDMDAISNEMDNAANVNAVCNNNSQAKFDNCRNIMCAGSSGSDCSGVGVSAAAPTHSNSGAIEINEKSSLTTPHYHHSHNSHGHHHHSHHHQQQQQDKMRKVQRERLISSSLVRTPIVDGEFEDFHQHALKTSVDKFDPKYKLYAVVSHSGMLNGGHYVSYAANQNGSWYCYNDSSCREISSQQPHIDPSSAYLLFYERHGLDYEPYFPKLDGKVVIPSNNDLELDLDAAESDLKKSCAIS